MGSLFLVALAAQPGCSTADGPRGGPGDAVSFAREPLVGTAGQTTVNSATQSPHQRKAFHANGRHWVFYSDGVNIVYRTSADGVDFGATTAVRAGAIGLNFGLAFDGTYVHYAYADQTAATPLSYRRGLPNADGTITWSAAEQTAVAGVASTIYRVPAVAVDANGYPFIGYYSDAASDYPFITKASTNNGTWTTASGFPHQLSTTTATTWAVQPVALAGGRVLAIYGYAATKPSSKVWTGSAWATARANFTAVNQITSGTYASAVGQGDTAHFAYLTVATSAIKYLKFTYSAADTTYYGSWGTEESVQASVTATSTPTLSLDPASGDLYAFWGGSPTASSVYYKRRPAAGAWDASPTAWIVETADTLTTNLGLSAYAQLAAGTTGLLYEVKAATPFYVRLGTLTPATTSVSPTSTVNTATQSPHQRKAFYANGRHWIFYSNGTSIVYQTSTDGLVWGAATVVRAGTVGLNFGLAFDGTYVHYAHADQTAATPLYYRRGLPNAGGSITWSAEQVAVAGVAATIYRVPAVAVDANGYPFIGYYSDAASDYPFITKAATNDGTWTAAAGFPHQLATTTATTWAVQPVALAGGRMLAIYGYAATKPSSKVWTGSAWATARASFTAVNQITSGTYASAVGQGDTAHFAYLTVATSAIKYLKFTYSAADTTYYGAWSAEESVQASVTGTSAPTLSLDSASGDLYAFWAGSPTANHIYFKRRPAAGAWDANPTDWLTETTETLPANDRLTAYATGVPMKLGLLYVTKAATPFNVKLALLESQSVATPGTSTVNTATLSPHQRKAFYAAGRHWVFYSDGTNIVYRTSTDATTWSATTTVRAGTSGANFGLFFDGVYLHYAHADQTAATALYYRRGLANADGTISWSAAEQTAVAGVAATTYRVPAIAVDANGYPFIGYLADAASDYPYVTKAAGNDGTWATASGFPHQLATTSAATWAVLPVPLAAGRVLAIYGYTTTKPSSKLWTGSAWATARANFTAANQITSGTYMSAAGQGDLAHFAYLTVATSAVKYLKFTYNAADTTYYGWWGTEEAVQASVTATSTPALSLDPGNGDVYVLWAGSPTANHIYYKRRPLGGVWDVAPNGLTNEAAETLTANDRLASGAELAPGLLTVLYETRAATPWNVKVARSQLGVCGNGLKEPGEECEAPFDACCDSATCAFKARTAVCRAAAGPCDAIELCTGAAAACPADAKVAAGTLCRGVAGPCDVAETCTGAADACPADAKVAAGTVCRAAVDVCDAAEACDGANAACPADAKQPSTVVCRASAGACDVAENCTGTTNACPTDAKRPSSYVCRTAAGPCDVAENCTGTTNACPTDAKRPSSYVCRTAAGPCDVAENCTGSAATCPTDAFLPATTVCRLPAGPCDAVELCTGSAAACPADAKKAAGTVCRESRGSCDPAEVCAGGTNACPTDVLVTAGTACDSGNSCTTGSVCQSLGTCYAGPNVCDAPGAFAATPQADGVKLTWALPRINLFGPGVGDFESGVDGFTRYGNADVVVESVAGVGQIGTRGLHLVSSATLHGGGNSGGATRALPTMTAGKTYTISYWAKGLDNFSTMSVSLQNGDGAQNCLSHANALTAAWQRFTKTCTLDVAKTTLYLWAGNPQMNWAIDGLQIEEGATSSDYTRLATAIEVYRTDGSVTVDQPGAVPAARIYSGLATSYTDSTVAAGGTAYYTAFAIYPGGWSLPALASIRPDDTDGDGMADAWELANGLDAYNAGDALLDGDGDGLSNLAEYLAGTSASVADTDGDGLADGYEVAAGLDPTKQDSDGDGMADGFEIATGLDPKNGHDFAIGDFSLSDKHILGAYVFDSGTYAFNPTTGLPTIGAGDKALVIASDAQLTAIGLAGSAGLYMYSGYLYTTEEYIAPNYPPVCSAGLDQSVTLPGTARLAGSASDPNGDPVVFSWSFVQKPAQSTATLTGANTATPSFVPDKYGYYMLELAVQDVTGLVGAPCYTVVTVIDAQTFYRSGPYVALSSSAKLIGFTTSNTGTLPAGMASATRQLGHVGGDRSVMGDAVSTSTDIAGGFLGTAYASVDFSGDPNIVNVAPVAEAGPDQTLAAGGLVTLDGSGSRDPDAYPSALTYEWTIWQKPAGSTLDYANLAPGRTSPAIQFTPDKAGSYVFTLKVYDGNLWSVPSGVVVTVTNMPPVANAGPDQFLVFGSPAPLVTLNGGASYDPEGRALAYFWRAFRYPSGAAPVLAGADTATPSFTPAKAGYYWFELIVKDGILVSTPDYVTISVGDSSSNLPPVAVVGPPQELMGVNLTALDGWGSYDPDWDSAGYPDPQNGVFRKGMSYDWQKVAFTPIPSGGPDCSASASLQCAVCAGGSPPAWCVTTPADCPNPTLRFNGCNGTYTFQLRTIDQQLAVSDPVTTAVTARGIPDEPPVAVAAPPFTKVNLAQALRQVDLSGASSFDPINASEVLTYKWTLVEKPVGSNPTLTRVGSFSTNPTAAIVIDKAGRYKLHLQTCDAGGKCSCAYNETRPGDAACNDRQSHAIVSTADDSQRVAMPAGWPGAGAPGGSGGRMMLLKSPDGVYDKPVLVTVGFTGFFAAQNGSTSGAFGPFGSIIEMLRSRGYDVWWLEYDPVCSGGATPNLDANWAWGGEDFCKSTVCACPYPQQPVDNAIELNSVVFDWAMKAVKGYGACAGKSADDPTDPCFVRVFGPSMGGVIARLGLAWAEDPTTTTVPGAAPGVRAKPARGTEGVASSSDRWDLGARVFISGDAPMQGANVPVALMAMAKAFEASTPSQGDSGGAFAGLGFQTSGWQNLIAWSFIGHKGLRNWVIDHRELLMQLQGAGDSPLGQAASYLGLLHTISKIVNGTFSAPGPFGIAFSAVSGFLEGMVAGWGDAILGAVIKGAWAYLEAQLVLYLCSLGPWGVLAAVVYVILDFFFDIGSFLFSVKTKFIIKPVPEKSQAMLSPFSMTTIFEAPAAKQLLYERVTAYKTCPDAPMLLQGQSVPNTWPAGFGKEKNGRICKGQPNITTSSADHDAFYGYLKSLNGGKGYPTLTRNVGLAFGSGEPTMAAKTKGVMELYLPYVMANQRYPLYARDRQPGSIFGTEIVPQLKDFQLWFKGILEIKKRILFHTSTSRKTLFDDRVYFPEKALMDGALWPFIPTESALDLTRATGCSAQLPCCQLLPRGTEPHPQAGPGLEQNCCLCSTPFDTTIRPNQNLLHSAAGIVNPCRRGQNPQAPLLEALRTECVSSWQGQQTGQVQMCPGDNTWYLLETPSGYMCSAAHDDTPTHELIQILSKAVAQADVRPSCAATSATRVCLNGAPTCTDAEASWFWVGGTDKDGDGCPGRTLSNGTVCPSYCETDVQDGDPTLVGHVPNNNTPPTITSVSPQQMFRLPTCWAQPELRAYNCAVSEVAVATPLTLSVSAADPPDNDPLTYLWEFLPDDDQGQHAGDLSFSNPGSPTPRVAVATANRPPQGTYRVRVTVFDNKGGATSAETSVVVPGDQPPAVTASAPASVNQLCEFDTEVTEDPYRCYADLVLSGTVVDPDGPDSTSILMMYWEDLTDREQSGYRAVTLVDDPLLASPGMEVYSSGTDTSTVDATTPVGFPLVMRLTAIDIRGQRASAEVSIRVCPTAGCP
jgi:hypothetical protein